MHVGGSFQPVSGAGGQQLSAQIDRPDARKRLARNPNERMRTKPRGRTWSRKRRRNSLRSERHPSLLIPVGIILPAKGNPVPVEG